MGAREYFYPFHRIFFEPFPLGAVHILRSHFWGSRSWSSFKSRGLKDIKYSLTCLPSLSPMSNVLMLTFPVQFDRVECVPFSRCFNGICKNLCRSADLPSRCTNQWITRWSGLIIYNHLLFIRYSCCHSLIGDIETSLQTHPNIISPYPPKVTANLVPFVMISLSTRMCWRSRSSLKRWSSGNCRPDCWSPEDHWWSDKNSDKWSSKLQTWNPYIFNSVLILKAGEVWTLWYFKYRCKTMTDHLDVGLCQWWWWWVVLILQWLSWVIPGDCYGRHSR